LAARLASANNAPIGLVSMASNTSDQRNHDHVVGSAVSPWPTPGRIHLIAFPKQAIASLIAVSEHSFRLFGRWQTILNLGATSPSFGINSQKQHQA
jgi:hypothetical protein